MRLAILVSLAVVILGGAAGSYYHYVWWGEHRYDDIILQAAARHRVDPALVKALVKVQTDFAPNAVVEKDDAVIARGFMLVPTRVANEYLAQHGRDEWGYICVHRRFRNHDPSKPEQFTSTKEGSTCNAPGCRQPLVHELLDPATNLEVGCWFLALAHETLVQSHRELNPGELTAWTLVAFRYGLPDELSEMTLEQKMFVTTIFKTAVEYRPYFERRARRAAARQQQHPPASPFHP